MAKPIPQKAKRYVAHGRKVKPTTITQTTPLITQTTPLVIQSHFTDTVPTPSKYWQTDKTQALSVERTMIVGDCCLFFPDESWHFARFGSKINFFCEQKDWLLAKSKLTRAKRTLFPPQTQIQNLPGNAGLDYLCQSA